METATTTATARPTVNGKPIPTWAVILATGMGLVFYAQREFVPRTEASLIIVNRDAQMKKLEETDEKLAKRISETADLIEKSNQQMMEALDRHANASMHPGTAEQFAALYTVLNALQNGQRIQYDGVAALLRKNGIQPAPLPEYPALPGIAYPQTPLHAVNPPGARR